MIKPTVGRVVWYWPHENEGFGIINPEQPCAATVAFVHPDDTINLAVNDHDGDTWSVHGIALLEGDATPEQMTEGGVAQWMPYQRQQAEKHGS